MKARGMAWLVSIAANPLMLWLALAGALVFGLSRQRGGAAAARWWGIGLLGGLVGLILAASTGLSGYAVVAMAGLLSVLLPLVLGALGLLLGGALAALRHRGHGRRAAGLAVLILARPMAGMHLVRERAIEDRAHRAACYAAFQQQTIEGTMAGHAIRVPASPDLETVHRTPSRDRATARTRFWQAGGRLQTGRDTLEGAPDVTEIVRLSSAPDCDGPERAHHCRTSPKKLAVWCATRPELGGTPWCDRPRHRLELGLRRTGSAPPWSGWSLAPLPPIAVDALGADVMLRCSDRPRAPQDGSPPLTACGFSFALTNGIEAEAHLYDVPMDARLDEARAMHAYALALWASLTGAG
ncbi:MAG: hypothetical protein AAGC57_09495 [Pseudomonadota bacterium]